MGRMRGLAELTMLGLAVAGIITATRPADKVAEALAAAAEPIRCEVVGYCDVCDGPNLGPTWKPGERPFDLWNVGPDGKPLD